MMNRKADLLNDVLTTIIAVIGLVLIIFAAWKLWSIYANQEERNAQKLADSIAGKIDALEDGQINSFVFSGFSGGEGWFLDAFNKNEIRPDNCYFENCICICKGEPSLGLYNEGEWKAGTSGGKRIVDIEQQKVANFCQAKGFCRILDRRIEIHGDILSPEPVLEEYKILYRALVVPEKLFEIEIKKTGDRIEIFPK